MIAQLAKVLNS